MEFVKQAISDEPSQYAIFINVKLTDYTNSAKKRPNACVIIILNALLEKLVVEKATRLKFTNNVSSKSYGETNAARISYIHGMTLLG